MEGNRDPPVKTRGQSCLSILFGSTDPWTFMQHNNSTGGQQSLA